MKGLEILQDNTDYLKFFTLEMAKLGELYNQEMTQLKANAYWEVISEEMDYKTFQFSIRAVKKTFKSEYGVKFPTPAHFIEAVEKMKGSPEANFDYYYGVWQSEIHKCDRFVGGKEIRQLIPDESFLDIMDDQGGEFEFKKWSANDWNYNRSRLKEYYLGKIRVEESKKLLPSNKEAKKIVADLSKQIKGV